MIQQGHKYLNNRTWQQVIALEVLPYFVRVGVLGSAGSVWFREIENVEFQDLIPLPMKYFHGQIPK